MKVIIRMLDDAYLNLQTATTDEQAAAIMEQIANLTKVKKSFSMERLGERAICR